MRAVRGNAISMIFQEPMTSLNPVYSVGWQIMEALRLHRKNGRGEARARTIELLRLVGIAEPGDERRRVPSRALLAVKRQRVMIMMALAMPIQLLLADEPTTALDVTIQAQILALLGDLQRRFSMSILLITHDLGLVAEHRSAHDGGDVARVGRVVESAPVRDLFTKPMHPYTRGLLESIPRPGRGRGRRLQAIDGLVPDMRKLPSGCRFADRCPMRVEKCTREEPELSSVAPGRSSRCFRADEVSP